MALLNNHWYSVKAQSLAVYARNVGFDLAVFSDYSDAVRKALKAAAINEAMRQIQLACTEQGFDLSSIEEGVYVISLANPLSIQYATDRSQVIYIGRGDIVSRIKSHFGNSLFKLMQSLSGAEFDFHFARPTRKGKKLGYYKHVEYLMLDHFSTKCGGLSEKRRFPLLNKKAGEDLGFNQGSEWWKKPLKKNGQRPLWELIPTDFSDFATLDDSSK